MPPSLTALRLVIMVMAGISAAWIKAARNIATVTTIPAFLTSRAAAIEDPKGSRLAVLRKVTRGVAKACTGAFHRRRRRAVRTLASVAVLAAKVASTGKTSETGCFAIVMSTVARRGKVAVRASSLFVDHAAKVASTHKASVTE